MVVGWKCFGACATIAIKKNKKVGKRGRGFHTEQPQKLKPVSICRAREGGSESTKQTKNWKAPTREG